MKNYASVMDVHVRFQIQTMLRSTMRLALFCCVHTLVVRQDAADGWSPGVLRPVPRVLRNLSKT